MRQGFNPPNRRIQFVILVFAIIKFPGQTYFKVLLKKFHLMRWFKKIITRLKHIRSSPHLIAKSFAIGVFIGILPGTGLVVALLVAILFRLNKTSIALGALTNNPWTTAFIYAGSYKIGQWILRTKTQIAWQEFLTWHGFTFKDLGLAMTPFLIGGIILAFLCACAGYGIVYFMLVLYKSRMDHHELSRNVLNEGSGGVK